MYPEISITEVSFKTFPLKCDDTFSSVNNNSSLTEETNEEAANFFKYIASGILKEIHLFLNFEAFQLAYREKTINNVLHTNTFNKKAVTVERKSMFPSQTILVMAGTSETRCLLFLSIKPR